MNYIKPTENLEEILLKAAAPSEDKKCLLFRSFITSGKILC